MASETGSNTIYGTQESAASPSSNGPVESTGRTHEGDRHEVEVIHGGSSVPTEYTNRGDAYTSPIGLTGSTHDGDGHEVEVIHSGSSVPTEYAFRGDTYTSPLEPTGSTHDGDWHEVEVIHRGSSVPTEHTNRGDCQEESKEMEGEREEDLPRDAEIIMSLLKSMGVEDYEPGVVHQFLELYHRYIADVLTDAQVYSEHASKTTIDCDDVKLAIQLKVNSSFSQPPPREILLELARDVNKIPLPKKNVGLAISLPPEQDTLISRNYRLAVQRGQQPDAVEELDESDDEAEKDATNSPMQEE